MKASKAREIIEQALEDETFEGEVPKDDKKAVEVANGLIDMAVDAWSQDIRGDEVENILKLAGRLDEDGDLVEVEEEVEEEKPAAKAKPKPAAKSKPKPKPKAEPEPEPEEEPEAEVEADPRASDEPWEGYAADPVKDIIEGIEVWGENEEYDDVLHVLIFESANKNRVRIVNKCVEILPEDKIPHDEPESEPEAEEVDAEPEVEDGGPTEPYEGYAEAKIKDIKSSLEEFVEDEEYDDEAKLATLEGTLAFEKVNKNRTSLIDFIEGLKSNLEAADGEEVAEGEASEEGDAEDAAASEADAGAEDSDQGGEEDREESRPAAAKRSRGARSGADSEAAGPFVISTKYGKTEVQVTVEGKHAAAGVLLDLIENGATAITVDVG
jgi:hypothetical protein